MGTVAPPTSAGYTALTQAQAIAALGDRMGDSGYVHWTQSEWRAYLAEALHTWQALTGWYRTNAPLAGVSNGTSWYDLNAIWASVTDADLVNQICSHLLEPQLGAGNSWVGSEQFALAGIEAAIQHALDRFLGDSGAVASRTAVNYTSVPPNPTLILPSVIDVVRVAWLSSNLYADWEPLWRANEWEVRAFPATSTEPIAYTDAATPPATIRLVPPPQTSGVVEVIGISSGPALSLPARTTVLTIPDDFAWGVKWGALAAILSKDGESKDALRAAYAEARYQEAVECAKRMPSVLQVFVNGQPLWVGSVRDMDTYNPGWQDEVGNEGPRAIGMIGRNLLALSPLMPMWGPAAIPIVWGEAESDMAAWGDISTTPTIALDMVTTIPTPATDGDFLQAPADVIAPLLDYAQHLASFKLGGQEFLATETLRQSLIRQAALYNDRLRQINLFNDALRSPAFTQWAEQPRLSNPVTVAYSLSQGNAPQGNANG